MREPTNERMLFDDRIVPFAVFLRIEHYLLIINKVWIAGLQLMRLIMLKNQKINLKLKIFFLEPSLEIDIHFLFVFIKLIVR